MSDGSGLSPSFVSGACDISGLLPYDRVQKLRPESDHEAGATEDFREDGSLGASFPELRGGRTFQNRRGELQSVEADGVRTAGKEVTFRFLGAVHWKPTLWQ